MTCAVPANIPGLEAAQRPGMANIGMQRSKPRASAAMVFSSQFGGPTAPASSNFACRLASNMPQ